MNTKSVGGGAVYHAPDSFQEVGLGVVVNSNQLRALLLKKKTVNLQLAGYSKRSETAPMSSSRRIIIFQRRYGIEITSDGLGRGCVSILIWGRTRGGQLATRSMLDFSTDWVIGARNAIVEERRTLCDLRIYVDGKNVCVFDDYEDNTTLDRLTVPAVHLAEGIANNWWQILGSRDREQSITRYRSGFALPDLIFRSDGSTFEVFSRVYYSRNPHIRFKAEARTTLTRAEAEQALGKFVHAVVDRLDGAGIDTSEVGICWKRVSESRHDPEERAFCESAGALGADPYSIAEDDEEFIEASSGFFSDEALIEFLAGTTRGDRSVYSAEWLNNLERRPQKASILPDLAGLHVVIREHVRRDPHDRPWAVGYRAARACRRILGAGEGVRYSSVAAISRALGSDHFGTTEIEGDIRALISHDKGQTHIHLHEHGSPAANNFALGRAMGDSIVFRESGRAVVNNLRHAERQATGRAFAAEFLAPVNEVMGMSHDGKDTEEIADEFDVGPQVILDQLHNWQRIEEACTAA